MPKLNNFPTAQQQTKYSCWACAAREINNWYQSLGQSGAFPEYATDEAFANEWATVTNDPAHTNIDVQQPAAAALDDLGYTNNTDDHALPTANEIDEQIRENRPLLAIVGDAPPKPNPNPHYQKGHWVVIVGISADGSTIDVFDPANGQINTVAYNAETYQCGSYWENTSYVDSQ